MSIDTHDGLDVAGMSDDELADVIAKVRERGAWKLVGATGQEDVIVDADRNVLFLVEHIPFRYAHQIAQMPAAIMLLTTRLEAAERERDALREAARWRTVAEKPSGDIERCLLLNRQRGYDAHLFGTYSITGGWFWFSQYGDGSEYPEPLGDGEWLWFPLPQPPQGGA